RRGGAPPARELGPRGPRGRGRAAGRHPHPLGPATGPARPDSGAGGIASAPAVCVFDLDHTLVDSPLDLKAVGREMEAFLRARGVPVPPRALRWSGAELFDLVRREALHLEAELLAIPVAHERRAMAAATLIPFAREAVGGLQQLVFPDP